MPLAALLAILSFASAGVRQTQAPIDRRAWMTPSPARPLALLKPARGGPDYPSLADYLRVLERFPLLAERGWRAPYPGGPEAGFFGDPDSAEMGLRSAGNFVVVLAVLAVDPGYDPAASGVARSRVLQLAIDGIEAMTRTHVTGDRVCGDGKRWGDHWQSAWWTAKMAVGARLLWRHLSPEQRARVERVVAHEADRHLGRRPPGGALSNTRSEENAWDCEVLAAALALLPRHEHARAWRAKLVDFAMNTLSAPQDARDSALVDGRPVREQVYTTNVHADFTIENHGAYHACYMACPLHSLAWCHLALTLAGQRPPEALNHHFGDVFRRLAPTFLETRFAYLAGKDWPRWAYGLSFILPALVLQQHRERDAVARTIEARRFRALEEEQAENADGTLFGARFTRNVMMDRLLEYETDGYANLAAAYLLHRQRGGRILQPLDDATLERRLSERHASPEAGFVFARSPRVFASLTWRELRGPYPMAFFVPQGMDSAAEWGPNNLLGRITVEGIDPAGAETQSRMELTASGFRAEGAVRYRFRSGAPAFTHHVRVEANDEAGIAMIETRFVADADIETTSVEGLRLHVANDRFNGGQRRWQWEGGATELTFDIRGPQPERETLRVVEFPSRWVNLDDRLGIVALDEDAKGFALRVSDRRNGPWGSVHYDVLDAPLLSSGRLRWVKGDTILRGRFLLLAGDAEQTRAEWRRRAGAQR